MKNPLLAAVAATFAATSLAGPYDQPYAIVESGSKSEVRKEVPAAVTKVDGASTKNPRRSDPIPPGLHKVTVASKVENATRPEWEPKVYPEPIGECKKKFGTPAAGK